MADKRSAVSGIPAGFEIGPATTLSVDDVHPLGAHLVANKRIIEWAQASGLAGIP